jgi:hypothetical protein
MGQTLSSPIARHYRRLPCSSTHMLCVDADGSGAIGPGAAPYRNSRGVPDAHEAAVKVFFYPFTI